MTERLSTGLRNFLLGEGSMRKAFEDCVMNIYSGSAPAEADDVVTGVLLAQISVSGGAVTTTTRSTPNDWKIVLEAEHDQGDTCIVHIVYNGDAGTDYTFTLGAAHDALDLRLGVCRMLNDIPYLQAVETEDATPTVLYVSCRIPGDVVVITDGTGDITITPTESEEEARSTALWFAAPSAGAMSKSTDVWSDTVIVSGVAGYFRIVQSCDDGTDSSTAVRLQGSVSTSGAELNLSNTSLVALTVLTIDTYSISLPAE